MMEPTADPGKPFGLTVKAIIADESGRVLLLQRPEASKHFAGPWEFPGGKVDTGEPFDAALKREVAEETALGIRLEKVAGATHYEMTGKRLAVLFIEARWESGEVRLSDEHDDYQWVPLSELTELNMSDQPKALLTEYTQRSGR